MNTAAVMSDDQLVRLCKAHESNPGIVRGILREHAARKATSPKSTGFDDRKLWASFEETFAEFDRLMKGDRHG